MLKGFQIMCFSSGFIRQRWGSAASGSGHPIIGVSDKPSSAASFPFPDCSYSTWRKLSSSLLFPFSSLSNTSPFRLFRLSASRSDSVSQDGLSSSSSDGLKFQESGSIHNIKFCQCCGGRTKHEIPFGEEKMRAICTMCGKVAYQNPKMVVGCLIEHEKKILLCKRKIQPSYGLWTLPAGFLEIGESTIEGALRETWEEAGVKVEVSSPFAQLDIPLIGQTYIIFLGKLEKPLFSPGPETLECRLCSLDNIPFDSMAFSSMVVTLNLYVEDLKTGRLKFHYGTINKSKPGTSPLDVHAYSLDHHMEC